jgi:2-dehydropantoate 2-reductase
VCVCVCVAVYLCSPPCSKDRHAAVLLLTSGERTKAALRYLPLLLNEAHQNGGEPGMVVTLQNGLGNEQLIGEVVGRERVLVGVTNQAALLQAPGRVLHTGTRGETVLLPLASQVQFARAFATHLSACGVPTRVEEDYKRAAHIRWRKLCVNACINPLTALLRVRNGALNAPDHVHQDTTGQPHRNQDTIHSLLREIVAEVAAVAEHEIGVRFDTDELLAEVLRVSEATAANRSSMLQALSSGRPTEINQINGSIAKLAHRHGMFMCVCVCVCVCVCTRV